MRQMRSVSHLSRFSGSRTTGPDTNDHDRQAGRDTECAELHREIISVALSAKQNGGQV